LVDNSALQKEGKKKTLHPDKFCEQYYSESDSITKLTNLSTGSVPLEINMLQKEF
jgi:hypothetical protein